MSSLIIIRQTKEEWEAQDIALPETYIGVESDIVDGVETGTLKAKLFDGIHTWDELDYWDSSGGGSSGAIWGAITGNIAEQEDLQSILSTFQPVDTDLTTIAALTPSNDDFLQRKSGAWANRNITQVITDLGSNDARHLSTIGTLNVAGTGTISPGASAFEYDIVRATGVLTGTRTVNWPGDSTDRRQILFWNDTSGSFDLYVKQTSEAGTGIRTTQGAQSILINDGTQVIDVTAAITRVPFYVLEWDGSPQTVDLGPLYPFDIDLGPCLYECWVKRAVGSNNGQYDWSEGFGGAHAMLRNSVGGNTYRGFFVIDASNTTPIVITTSKAHGLTTGAGEIYDIHGVLGNTAANVGLPTITVLSATTFSIDGSVGNGMYLGGGTGYGYPTVGGWGLVDFGSDDHAYDGQWHHSATSFANADAGVGIQALIQFYDGIPVGFQAVPGVRMCPSLGGNGYGFLGGSDHSNFQGRIAQYRIFEGSSPRTDHSTQYRPVGAFAPETIFGSSSSDLDGNPCHASILFSFYQPEQMITDHGIGFPVGFTHSARVYGSELGVGPRSTYPSPQYVIDATAPNTLALVAPVQPAGRAYSPLTPPAGAIIYDSIERKNSTWAFDATGGMGSTESGSRGPLAWQESPAPLHDYSPRNFGILNEQFVSLANGNAGEIAYVDAGATDLDIQVTRVGPGTRGSGGIGSIVFRFADSSNYWVYYVYTFPAATGTAGWAVEKHVAGVITSVASGSGTNFGNVLRVVTKSDGTWHVYLSGTSISSGTSSDLASNTKVGIAGIGGFASLTNRSKYFTVLPG